MAIGQGTGPELAGVFRQALAAISGRYVAHLEVVASPHRYRTYHGLRAEEASPEEMARIAREDANHYVDFLRELHDGGVPAVFRTAINAQPLYRVRERLHAIKIERLQTAEGELLLVRDQTQGFYAGVTDPDESGAGDTFRHTCEFRRDGTRLVLDHARRVGEAAWGDDGIDELVMVYKFHVIDSRFARWVDEYADEHGLRIQLYQPDTANRQLSRNALRGRVLVVGANEWADIMHAELIQRHGQGSQEERFSENVYLHPSVAGLIEYQTVHGSADDIGGRGVVNPSATLRAAAHLLEHHGGCAGAVGRMEEALVSCVRSGRLTPDRGGRSSTAEVVERVLEAFARPATPGWSAGARRKAEALVVIDLQNDFAAPDGGFHRRGLIDCARTGAVASTVAELARRARARGVPVVFVRTLADDGRLSRPLAKRRKAEGRDDCTRPGSWGAGWYGVEPQSGELVVTKAGYDPFLGTTLERELRARGVDRLVLAGLFSDVCVDAAARTACQLGFEVAVVPEGTLALERDDSDCLAFMTRYYGARLPAASALFVEGADGEPDSAFEDHEDATECPA